MSNPLIYRQSTFGAPLPEFPTVLQASTVVSMRRSHSISLHRFGWVNQHRVYLNLVHNPRTSYVRSKTVILKISWLGQVALSLNDVRVQPNRPSRKADVLLAYLALNTNIIHERSKLTDYFCFDVQNPANNFRTILKCARDMIGKNSTRRGYKITKANGEGAVRFEPAAHLFIDVLEFRKPFNHTPTIETLMQKVALYSGPFMPGYESLDSIGWVEQIRAGLDRQFCDWMKRLLDELFAAERWNDIITWAEHWIAHSDMPRDAYNDLMAAYSELGDLPKLDATYERYKRTLEDIGVTPSEELQRQFDFWHAALVDSYRKPSESDRDPSKKMLPKLPTPKKPKPLRLPFTTFIGRKGELDSIAKQLANPECQLLTLVGIGGVGKGGDIDVGNLVQGRSDIRGQYVGGGDIQREGLF